MLTRAIRFLRRVKRGGALRTCSPASSPRILLPAAPGSAGGEGNRRLRAFEKHLGTLATIASYSALLFISYQGPEGNGALEEEADRKNSGAENVFDVTKNLFTENEEIDVSGKATYLQKSIDSQGIHESVEDLLASDRKDLSLDELFAADNKYFLYGLQKQWYEEWHAADANRPEYVDWVEAGAVTSVMRQGLCGSCGCIASVGAAESAYKIKKGKLHTFSTQQLLDCDKYGGSCYGCYSYLNFLYMSMNGIVRAEDYPYKAEQGQCMSTEGMATFKILGYVPIEALDEEQLRIAVARQPVVMYVHPNEAFQNFKGGGIIELEDCPPVDKIDPERLHSVLVVGYGTDPDGRKWWKIKNSWGTTWGDGGYAKLRRDVSDPRGVASLTALPGLYTNR